MGLPETIAAAVSDAFKALDELALDAVLKRQHSSFDVVTGEVVVSEQEEVFRVLKVTELVYVNSVPQTVTKVYLKPRPNPPSRGDKLVFANSEWVVIEVQDDTFLVTLTVTKSNDQDV
jgi:hypothetical protein